MSQHVSETCNESSGLWLPLTEYAVKSGISLSTIRRKIKSNALTYRLENGRYLILYRDQGADESAASGPSVEARQGAEVGVKVRPISVKPESEAPAAEASVDTLPIVERSVSMVSEAFEHALREKEKRIRLLETRNAELQERLDELRLLVQVLEERYEVRY